ncbi:MAG: TolC family protein [Spirochaetota bacterium]
MARTPVRCTVPVAVARAAALIALLAAARLSAQEPLTLEEAIELAQGASQPLERSRLEVTGARAGVAEARAARGPSLDASAGAAWLANPPEGITIPAGEFGTVTDPGSTFPTRVPDQPIELVPDAERLGLSASLTVEQPLFTWGKLVAGEDAAQAGLEASESRRELARRDVRRAVVSAYAAVAAARASEPLVAEIVSILEERLGDARERLDAGAITRRAVLAEEAVLAEAEVQLARARQGMRTAEMTLEWLVGREVGEVAGIDLPDSLAEEARLVERARDGHPRLAELRATARQAEVGLRVTEASRPPLPDIGLNVKAEVQGQRVPFVQANWIDTWDANLTVSIGASATLYDGFANAAQQNDARSQYDRALSAVAEYDDSLALQIRRHLERYHVAQASLREAQARVASADEERRVAEAGYENELVTRGELLGARAGVLEAELASVAARLEMAQSLAEVEYLAGQVR